MLARGFEPTPFTKQPITFYNGREVARLELVAADEWFDIILLAEDFAKGAALRFEFSHWVSNHSPVQRRIEFGCPDCWA